jgi:hypothetical protein
MTPLTLVRRLAWAYVWTITTAVVAAIDARAPEPGNTGHTAEPVELWEDSA